jgi:hypothetical protein
VLASGWKSFSSTSSVMMSPTRTVAVSFSATGGWWRVSAGTGTTVTPAVAVAAPSEIVYVKPTCSTSACVVVTRISVDSSSSTTTPLASTSAGTSIDCTARILPVGLASFESTDTVTGCSLRTYAVSLTATGGSVASSGRSSTSTRMMPSLVFAPACSVYFM